MKANEVRNVAEVDQVDAEAEQDEEACKDRALDDGERHSSLYMTEWKMQW